MSSDRSISRLWIALLLLGLAADGAAQDARCTALARADRQGHFVADADLSRPGGRDGDDLLVLVDRSPDGVLSPGYAPRDLVDVVDLRPRQPHQCTPPQTQCLRRDAAIAYRAMANAMVAAGLAPHVSSAFRSYSVQCATFARWTTRERTGFCGAVSTSALPGHSQHQLGTTLDLFTHDWLEGGDKFRAGFGCTPGGRWLAEHAEEYGFALPYPLHPAYRDGAACRAVRGDETRIDPRTGYRYEPWHLRFIGVANAARFRQDRLASGVDSLNELTLDQWMRRGAGLLDRVVAPVCDGCNCTRCATYAAEGEGPCASPALRLAPDGSPSERPAPPRLGTASLARAADGALLVTVEVNVSPNTLTQPPVMVAERGAHFRFGQAGPELGPGPQPDYAQLSRAWRLGIGLGDGTDLPHRVALAELRADDTPNGANARFPAPPGSFAMQIRITDVPAGTPVRVGLVSLDEALHVQRMSAP